MKVTFVTNYVHHHQVPLADEFYSILGDNYRYISTKPLPDWLAKGGYDSTLDRPYIIRTYADSSSMAKARDLIDNSDVVIIGSAPDEWVYKRKLQNKVTFHYRERLLKRISIHTFSPKLIYARLKHYTRFRNKRTYMLCASAYTSKDVRWYGAFPRKCFKWGYFTTVNDEYNIPPQDITSTKITHIMWCARFLKLKHPELAVMLAAQLKENGYPFVLDMYGSGEELENTKKMAEKLCVTDVVNFCGNVPNAKILEAMRHHEIFLFTSDRNEGWGAVLNESMSSGCAVVGSHEVGSVPYLIKDKKNGLIFKSKDICSLYKKVTYLLDNPEDCEKMRKEAVLTMQNVWSPRNAAKAFLRLVDSILSNSMDKYDVQEGPASWA